MNKYEYARAKEIERIMNMSDLDDGKFGKVFELEIVRTLSHKATVAKQGETDYYMTIDGRRTAVEVKTNGGRIESLYKLNERQRATTMVIYTLHHTVPTRTRKDGSLAGGEVRVIEPIICTVEYFLNALESVNAIKVIGHNENDRERAIQKDSKKLYNLLKEYPIPYSKELKYTWEDFEGLE